MLPLVSNAQLDANYTSAVGREEEIQRARGGEQHVPIARALGGGLSTRPAFVPGGRSLVGMGMVSLWPLSVCYEESTHPAVISCGLPWPCSVQHSCP